MSGHEPYKSEIRSVAAVNNIECIIAQEILDLRSQADRVYGIGCCLAYFEFSVNHGLACRSEHAHPFTVLFLIKKGIKLAQHGAAIANQSGIGLPVPVDFV